MKINTLSTSTQRKSNAFNAALNNNFKQTTLVLTVTVFYSQTPVLNADSLSLTTLNSSIATSVITVFKAPKTNFNTVLNAISV